MIDFEFSQRLSPWLSEVRRDLHMHPELSEQEFRTTEKICAILEDLGINYHTLPESTGAVAVVRGAGPGPCLALRADIDALPVEELNPVPYRSREAGRMHACGHDANTAIMLGVARAVQEAGLAKQLKGSIKFLFQPAEEKINGAQKMIQQGVLEDPTVDRIIAGHMAPDLDVGKIGIFKHWGYAASDLFQLTITGRGGHGGRPHETIDPIVCGAQFVSAVQTIAARNVNPIDSAVISIGKFQAGDTGNVIPETAVLEGTIRTHKSRVRETVLNRMAQVIQGLETQFNVTCDLNTIFETPACNCDPEVSRFMHGVAGQVVGSDNVTWVPPTTGSEDFAYFTLEKPAAIIRLGCRNREKDIVSPLHSPYFDIDETVLATGVQVFYQAIQANFSHGWKAGSG